LYILCIIQFNRCIIFLILGIVSREADLFADDIFHYERRIVKHIEDAKADGSRQLNKLMRLADLKTKAPSVSAFN